ncbi:MAG TPA: hypothetical protein VGH16_05710 [Candidatus Binatia bacterium]
MPLRRFIAFVALALLLLTAPLAAGEQETGTFYLKDNAISLTAPNGWVLDENAGRPRFQGVFYPADSTWAASEAVMYVNTLARSVEPNMEAFIADDVARERENSPNLQVRAGDPIRLSDGKSARVNLLTGDKWGNFESVAYIDTSSDYVAIVLTSKNEAAYKSAQAAFVELVKSYRMLGPGAGL